MAGKRWVITGGSRGVGLATAQAALTAGDRVAVLARHIDESSLRQQLGTEALLVAADVSDAESVQAAMQHIGTAWQGIDVLVNNAGLHRGGKAAQLDLDDWNAVLATNLSGPLHCVRAALPFMGDPAAIVNIGAVVGLRGFPGDSAYGASKAGLAGLTQVLAMELASRGIRVNLVIPGFVLTEMTAQVDEKARERLIKAIPLRRVGTEAEIAQVIYWVAHSTYMTGAIIPTDGGLLCKL
jgi:3-oxoacyl-[acyl-carrier protein] reductase